MRDDDDDDDDILNWNETRIIQFKITLRILINYITLNQLHHDIGFLT